MDLPGHGQFIQSSEQQSEFRSLEELLKSITTQQDTTSSTNTSPLVEEALR
jgi:hypothetical protein